MFEIKNNKKVLIMAVVAAFGLFAISCASASSPVNNTNQTTTEETPNDTKEDTTVSDQKEEDNSNQTQGNPISVYNDTIELGTLAIFEPSDNIDANSGVAIAGSDEEQLQQERIAGGAVGEVVSKNLEPLKGITDYSEGEYVLMYGVTVE